MTDVKLPAGYEDWVEITDDYMRAQDHIRVRVVEWKLTPNASQLYQKTSVSERVFVPPKPKPTLPEVRPGAVISFKSRILGATRRAMRTSDYQWRVFDRGTPVVFCGNDFVDPKATDEQLLEVVDADGFKVELA